MEDLYGPEARKKQEAEEEKRKKMEKEKENLLLEKEKEREKEKEKYASLPDRAVAVIIDTIIVWVLSFVVGVVIGFMSVLMMIVDVYVDFESTATTVIFYLIGFCILLLYFTILEGPLGGGRTIGKRIVGIKVTTEDGKVPSYRATIIRNILRIIDGLFFYLVGAIQINSSSKNQRFGDRSAKTIVVKV